MLALEYGSEARKTFSSSMATDHESLWCTLLKVGKAKKNGSGIHVNNLKKTFHVKSENYSRLITAVSDLNLRVDTGQLVVLLGPNGAGKSTLMSILTTELIPSSGTAMVGGCDITKNRQTLREGAILGLCPQFDALYEELTVMEHLKLLSTVQNIEKNSMKELARAAGLGDYLDVSSRKLSGGNKRNYPRPSSIRFS